MAQQTIRAVYENGKLRPLDVVDFAEGQEIQLMVVSNRNTVADRHRIEIRQALGDLLVETPERVQEGIDEEALLQEIDNAFRDQPPLSQSIIDERRKGP